MSSKHQVTLPVDALTAAGVGVGDTLAVQAEGDGRLVLVRERDPLDDLIGSGVGPESELDLHALRDEWER